MTYRGGDVSLAERIAVPLARLPENERQAALDEALGAMTDVELRYLLSWEGQRRPSQEIDPTEDSTFVALIGGRGSGKTRGGAEAILDRIEADQIRHGALVSRTPGDVRRVMIEGPSGLTVCAERRGIRLVHRPSLAQIDVIGGGKISTYSAQEPDQLRGPEHDTLWADEFAAWPNKRDSMGNTAFSNAVAGLRAGDHPLGIFTTTPKAVPAVREIMTDESGLWRISQMSTWANAANLAPGFVATLQKMYGGTRLAAQEFDGLYLEDSEGALWSTIGLEESRVPFTPSTLDPAVALAEALAVVEDRAGGLPWRWVAVDPSGSEHGTGDEVGIVVGGVGLDRHLYVLADLSGALGARAWAERVVWACRTFQAPAVVEGNLARGLVAETLRSVDPSLPIEWTQASDGKRARAEPVAVLWEGDTRLGHIVGRLPGLESELTGWDSRTSKQSPGRLDALAWLGHKALEVMFAGTVEATSGASGITLVR